MNKASSFVNKRKGENMADLRFGAFLAPHHPIGENPTLQIQSDLEFVVHLERLGYD